VSRQQRLSFQREINGQARAAVGRSFHLQPGANRSGTIIHDLEAESLAIIVCALQTNAIIAYAAEQIVAVVAYFEHYIGDAGMLVGVDQRFAQYPVKLRSDLIVLDVGVAFERESAGCLPNLSVNQIAQGGFERC